VAVLLYYGAHYSAFLYHAKRRVWVCVDDSYVQEVGSQIYFIDLNFVLRLLK